MAYWVGALFRPGAGCWGRFYRDKHIKICSALTSSLTPSPPLYHRLTPFLTLCSPFTYTWVS